MPYATVHKEPQFHGWTALVQASGGPTLDDARIDATTGCFRWLPDNALGGALRKVFCRDRHEPTPEQVAIVLARRGWTVVDDPERLALEQVVHDWRYVEGLDPNVRIVRFYVRPQYECPECRGWAAIEPHPDTLLSDFDQDTARCCGPNPCGWTGTSSALVTIVDRH